jgi:hypothetical protein
MSYTPDETDAPDTHGFAPHTPVIALRTCPEGHAVAPVQVEPLNVPPPGHVNPASMMERSAMADPVNEKSMLHVAAPPVPG